MHLLKIFLTALFISAAGFLHPGISADNKIDELTGLASFYGKNLDGSKTATGEVFSNNEFTAASNLFKLHTKVKVTNLKNNKSVIVRINDRMHHRMVKKGRVIDLSRIAAKEISMIHSGLTKVKLQRLP